MEKCEAVTCQYNKLENAFYGYCLKESPLIKEDYTCVSYQERDISKVCCPNCKQLVIPTITEYEEGLETFEQGKLCPICEEYIYS